MFVLTENSTFACKIQLPYVKILKCNILPKLLYESHENIYEIPTLFNENIE